MSILCAITSLLQLVILVALTGVLASVAAVSRLMEVSISLIHPVTIFLLRQSGKLVIWSVMQSAKLTSRVYSRMCTMDCRTVSKIGTIEINMTTPEIPYARSVIPGLIQETYPGPVAETFEMTPFDGENGVGTIIEENGLDNYIAEKIVGEENGAKVVGEENDAKVVREENGVETVEEENVASVIGENGVGNVIGENGVETVTEAEEVAA